MSSRRRKIYKIQQMAKRRQAKQNDKQETRKAQKQKTSNLPLKSTLPNTLNASSPPLDRHYYVSFLNHPVSKEFNQLSAQTLSHWQ
jgi:hypothetical protein